MKTLKKGDRGDEVLTLQSWLRALEHYYGALDSIFGPRLNEAVCGFQSENMLLTDGICGPQTWGALEQAMNVVPNGRRQFDDAGDPVAAKPIDTTARLCPDDVWNHLLWAVDTLKNRSPYIGYGPGRGFYLEEDNTMVVTIGANGLGRTTYTSQRTPMTNAFTCSPFTYFMLCLIYRVPEFNRAQAGGMVSLTRVLTASFGIHPVEGSSYGHYGFGEFTQHVPSDGSSRKLIGHPCPKDSFGWKELYERRAELPEILFMGQSSKRKRNGEWTWVWGHHTVMLITRKDLPGMPMWRLAADGYKSSSKGFSGTPLSIQELPTSYLSKKDQFFDVYGLVDFDKALERPPANLGFEVAPEEVEFITHPQASA